MRKNIVISTFIISAVALYYFIKFCFVILGYINEDDIGDKSSAMFNAFVIFLFLGFIVFTLLSLLVGWNLKLTYYLYLGLAAFMLTYYDILMLKHTRLQKEREVISQLINETQPDLMKAKLEPETLADQFKAMEQHLQHYFINYECRSDKITLDVFNPCVGSLYQNVRASYYVQLYMEKGLYLNEITSHFQWVNSDFTDLLFDESIVLDSDEKYYRVVNLINLHSKVADYDRSSLSFIFEKVFPLTESKHYHKTQQLMLSMLPPTFGSELNAQQIALKVAVENVKNKNDDSLLLVLLNSSGYKEYGYSKLCNNEKLFYTYEAIKELPQLDIYLKLLLKQAKEECRAGTWNSYYFYNVDDLKPLYCQVLKYPQWVSQFKIMHPNLELEDVWYVKADAFCQSLPQ